MKQKTLHLVTGIASFFVLLFGIGAGHAMLAGSAMLGMGKQMAQNQCQSSCASQSNVVTPGQRVKVDDKDIEPRPVEPYYLAFISIGWTIAITISAAYLLRHLRWRPPDLFKLNVNFQF